MHFGCNGLSCNCIDLHGFCGCHIGTNRQCGCLDLSIPPLTPIPFNKLLPKSLISGSISGIEVLTIDNHQVEMSNVNFVDSGYIMVANDGFFIADSLNYVGNTGAMHILGSKFLLTNSKVNNTLEGGGIILENSVYDNLLTNVEISHNQGSGIFVKDAIVKITGCEIMHNSEFGYYGLNSGLSIFQDWSVIGDNEIFQINAPRPAFPIFQLSPGVTTKIEAISTVHPDAKLLAIDYEITPIIIPAPLPYWQPPVDCVNLEVDQNDPTMFFPNINHFLFDDGTRGIALDSYDVDLVNALFTGDYD